MVLFTPREGFATCVCLAALRRVESGAGSLWPNTASNTLSQPVGSYCFFFFDCGQSAVNNCWHDLPLFPTPPPFTRPSPRDVISCRRAPHPQPLHLFFLLSTAHWAAALRSPLPPDLYAFSLPRFPLHPDRKLVPRLGYGCFFFIFRFYSVIGFLLGLLGFQSINDRALLARARSGVFPQVPLSPTQAPPVPRFVGIFEAP